MSNKIGQGHAATIVNHFKVAFISKGKLSLNFNLSHSKQQDFKEVNHTLVKSPHSSHRMPVTYP